jgi:hypothetical protein
LAAEHCERAYLSAANLVRRQINQGFFVRLLIDEDGSVERVELTEQFAALLDGTFVQTTPATDTDTTSHVAGDATDASTVDTDATGSTAADVENEVTFRIKQQHAPWRHAGGARCER